MSKLSLHVCQFIHVLVIKLHLAKDVGTIHPPKKPNKTNKPKYPKTQILRLTGKVTPSYLTCNSTCIKKYLKVSGYSYISLNKIDVY